MTTLETSKPQFTFTQFGSGEGGGLRRRDLRQMRIAMGDRAGAGTADGGWGGR